MVVKVMINDQVFATRMVEDVFRNSTHHLNTDCVIPAAENSSSEEFDSVIDSILVCSEWEEEREGGYLDPDCGALELSSSKNLRMSGAMEVGSGGSSRVPDYLASPNKRYREIGLEEGIGAGKMGRRN